MNLRKYANGQFLYGFSIGLSLLVYFIGMLVPVMEIDGAVYAEVSREMYKNGNYLELYLKGQDWLDKPHFQFWITAMCFQLFGVSSFSYKLPAVLFMLIGAYYTYRFGEKFYSQKHGALAALLLMTSQHIITSNSDVRAEPYLTGLTVVSLYYLAVYLEEKKFIQLVMGSFGLACLLMTKGLFTIVPIASGLGLAMLYEKKWKEVWHWQWLAVMALTFIFIVPTLYGYYIQFDMHPEKELFGQQRISGIKFFLWDSQWGRFTNTGPIKGAGDPTFFLHTMLWAYLPWAFLAYFALYGKMRSLWQGDNTRETYTFFGFVFLFVVFSLSSFQLPHYLNALFPLLSIVTADILIRYSRNQKFLNTFYHIHLWSGVLILLLVALVHLIFSSQNPKADVYVACLSGLGIMTVLLIQKGEKLKKLIFIPVISVLLANYYINRHFYPELLTYQSESEVAFHMKSNDLDPEKLIVLGLREEMISFLQNRVVPNYELNEIGVEDLRERYIFTNQEGVDLIDSLGLSYNEIRSFSDFRITTLNGTFLNKRTRSKEIEIKYLLRIF